MLAQLADNGVQADVILLDLGVSSMQIDRPERGFSYAVDAPLDMRMDPSGSVTAQEVVNEWEERELATIFRRFGEERFARQIAHAIVLRRAAQPFERTGDLVETIRAAIPAPRRFGDGHPAKRVFQALRIAVNDELAALERRFQQRSRCCGRVGGSQSSASTRSRTGSSSGFSPPRRAAASARPTCRSACADVSPRCAC